MRKTLMIVMLAGSMALAACNTIAGAGRDVSSAGKAVENTANDVKH